MSSLLNAAQRAAYERDGYILIPSLFDAEEIALLRGAIETDPQLQASLYNRNDASGKATRMATWNHPGDSVYGLAARSHRVVGTMEDMLGGEVYHYHSKLTAKEPLEGGAWEWHQDYGYWYHNGCVFPYMASVMVALDKTTRENGCLQVIRGSHHAGRVEHGVLPGDQVGANPRRVEEMLKNLDLVYAEMAPGDGLFFHANVMHRSDQNRSPDRRWTVLFCYNAARNNPYLEHHHPQYTPLLKVDDEAVKKAGIRFAGDSDNYFRQGFTNPPELST
jgi:ectoine hydroxylase-related dioxygenase (phytanoyl-CoA dioxygenase family)